MFGSKQADGAIWALQWPWNYDVCFQAPTTSLLVLCGQLFQRCRFHQAAPLNFNMIEDVIIDLHVE